MLLFIIVKSSFSQYNLLSSLGELSNNLVEGNCIGSVSQGIIPQRVMPDGESCLMAGHA